MIDFYAFNENLTVQWEFDHASLNSASYLTSMQYLIPSHFNMTINSLYNDSEVGVDYFVSPRAQVRSNP